MTLLDAPKFDAARARRRQVFLYSTVISLFVLFIVWWLVAGRPVDWPWNWNNYLMARSTVNHFLTDVEKNDLPSAYAIWMHDKDWQQHEAQFNAHPYAEFLKEHGYGGKEDDLKSTVDEILTAAKQGDLPKAYGLWIQDADWQQHPAQSSSFPYDRFVKDFGSGGKDGGLDKDFANKLAAAYGDSIHDKEWQIHRDNLTRYPLPRFQQDWSGTSPDNEYGVIQSHQIAMAGRYGNGVLVAVLINGRKSKALNLDYDPKTKGLDFAPPGVELYLGP